jgi:hypothetical protein
VISYVWFILLHKQTKQHKKSNSKQKKKNTSNQKNKKQKVETGKDSTAKQEAEHSDHMFAKLQKMVSSDFGDVKNAQDMKWNISPKHIIINDKDCLGSGGFGTVYK